MEVLSAAKAGSKPAGCVTSFTVSGGVVRSLDGVSPGGEDEAWLARLDRGSQAVAGEQPVGFGDAIALRLGGEPGSGEGAPGDTGPRAGRTIWTDWTNRRVGIDRPRWTGRRTRAGREAWARGRPGRNADIACRFRARHSKAARVRCSVKK